MEKDVTLPGDPLTYIEPLLFNESMGRSLVESLMDKRSEQIDMTENIIDVKDETLEPLANLTEDYTGIGGMDTCSQCMYFTDLKDSTVEVTDIGEQDSSVITRTSGGMGAGIGICQVATRLEGKTKYVRKNDPVCTDGRPRTTPTDADRIKEEKTLDKIEIEVIKADYDKQIAEKDTLIFDETKKANSEREAKLKALGQITEHVETLKDKEHVIANLTTEITRLKEDRAKLREEQDNLREQISGLNVGIAGKDADIKHYKDQYDKYHRTYKELSNTEIMLKEQLKRAIDSRDEESTNRAEANQRALNAEEERARIAIENAALMEKLANLPASILALAAPLPRS